MKKIKLSFQALKVEDWSYILQPFLPDEVFRAMEQRKVRQVMVKDDFVVRFMGQTYYPDKHDLSGVMEHLASKLVKVYKLYGILVLWLRFVCGCLFIISLIIPRELC